MTRIEKIENIMKSNLSDEMKEEFVKLLFENGWIKWKVAVCNSEIEGL